MPETITNEQTLAITLQRFKDATTGLLAAWDRCGGDDLIAEYPDYLPSFEEFLHDVLAMDVRPAAPVLDLPKLPAVGTILRARYDLDIAGDFHAWPKGWAGEVVSFAGYHVHVRCFRYLGPGLHEWNNCRVLGPDDGIYAYEDRFGKLPGDEVSADALLALALDREFEAA